MRGRSVGGKGWTEGKLAGETPGGIGIFTVPALRSLSGVGSMTWPMRGSASSSTRIDSRKVRPVTEAPASRRLPAKCP